MTRSSIIEVQRYMCLLTLAWMVNMVTMKVVDEKTISSQSLSNVIFPSGPNQETNEEEETTNQIFDQPSENDVGIIVERMTRLESIVLEHRMEVERFKEDIREEVKVMRNATLLLLSIISGRGSDCQGIKDTASKIKILYAALAAYEPSLNFPTQFQTDFEVEEVSSQLSPVEVEEIETTTTVSATDTTAATSLSRYEVSEPASTRDNGLESDDLVWESFSEVGMNTSTQGWISSTRSGTTFSPTTLPSTVTTVAATTQKPSMTTKTKVRTTVPPTVCPRGSKRVGRECFSVHLDLQLNWTSARTFCRNKGGDLAEPRLHNDKLPKQLLKMWPAFGESSYWTLWVGATDQEKEGEWHWVTGGPLNLTESSRWNVEEAPELGEAQDCLAMILWVPGRWQRWDLLDDPCDLEWFFFCEYSP